MVVSIVWVSLVLSAIPLPASLTRVTSISSSSSFTFPRTFRAKMRQRCSVRPLPLPLPPFSSFLSAAAAAEEAALLFRLRTLDAEFAAGSTEEELRRRPRKDAAVDEADDRRRSNRLKLDLRRSISFFVARVKHFTEREARGASPHPWLLIRRKPHIGFVIYYVGVIKVQMS